MKEEMRQMGQWMNAGYRKVERLGGNVGYLALDGFLPADAAVEPAAAAMAFVANTDALIIDLRRNGGGEPESVALLCSYFFGSQPVHINSLYSRKENKTTDYWTRKEVAGKRYLGKDVYVLIGPRTFSERRSLPTTCRRRSVRCSSARQPAVGRTPGTWRRSATTSRCLCRLGRAINPITKTDWEGTGVKPDVAVPADKALEKAHELAIQKLSKNAKDDETRQRIQMDVEHSHERPMPKATAAVRRATAAAAAQRPLRVALTADS